MSLQKARVRLEQEKEVEVTNILVVVLRQLEDKERYCIKQLDGVRKSLEELEEDSTNLNSDELIEKYNRKDFR